MLWQPTLGTRNCKCNSIAQAEFGEIFVFHQRLLTPFLLLPFYRKELRNGRWQKAFTAAAETVVVEEPQIQVNRKATIVIEHLIQAADVAHMSQHWNIYRKWNECLFCEMYQAYREGRADTNPADGWYKGEIGFFDFYIIPLSEKLRDCGVFGPTSDENLNYAKNNRNMWVADGEEITRVMHQRVAAEYNAQKAKTDEHAAMEAAYKAAIGKEETSLAAPIVQKGADYFV